jgi:hypothetical protein
MVTQFCRGPSISGYIETPCTRIRDKTWAVTWDNCITHDGKVSGKSNSLCGTSTDRNKVRGCEDGSPLTNLTPAALVTRPGDIANTEFSPRKRRIYKINYRGLIIYAELLNAKRTLLNGAQQENFKVPQNFGCTSPLIWQWMLDLNKTTAPPNRIFRRFLRSVAGYRRTDKREIQTSETI